MLKNKTRPRECVEEVAAWIVQERETREKLKKEKAEVIASDRFFQIVADLLNSSRPKRKLRPRKRPRKRLVPKGCLHAPLV